MLDLADLGTLANLVELGALDAAKEHAARLLDTADIEEIETIMGTADILDSHANTPVVGMARLKAYARDLPDDHHRALVAFCATYTGDRTPVPATPNVQPLSVYQDHRPGFDPYAQPMGLTVSAEQDDDPAVWKARRAAQLTPRLRDDIDQLPRYLQEALSALPEKFTDATARRTQADKAAIRTANATAARIDLWFDSGYGRTLWGVQPENSKTGRTRAGRAARQTSAQAEPTPRAGKDYTRVFLGVRDIDKPDPDMPNTDPTRFDLYADDEPAEPEPQARPLDVIPCVSCWVERSRAEARRTDDGLCTECRERGCTGLDERAVSTVRLPAYLSRRTRDHAAQVTADCARVAAQMPRAAAKHWMRAYYRMATAAADRDLIALWVQQWDATVQADQPAAALTLAATA